MSILRLIIFMFAAAVLAHAVTLCGYKDAQCLRMCEGHKYEVSDNECYCIIDLKQNLKYSFDSGTYWAE